MIISKNKMAILIATFSFIILMFASKKEYVPSTFVLDAPEPVVLTYDFNLPWRQYPLTRISSTFEKSPEVIDIDVYFDPFDITQPSNLTYEQLHKYLATYCKNWVGLEDYLLSKDKEINLIFLLSVAKTETGAGIITHGWYNCFNIRQENSYAFVNYNSYEESIDDFIHLILNGYVAEDGIWYEEPWIDYNGVEHTSKSVHTIGLHYASEIWAPYIENICWEIKSFSEKIEES